MKLIIDIPEDVYKKTVFYREFRDLSDCVATIKALENGIPIPDNATVCDIEQIRADIEAARYGLITDGLDVALRIIDKHTKGE